MYKAQCWVGLAGLLRTVRGWRLGREGRPSGQGHGQIVGSGYQRNSFRRSLKEEFRSHRVLVSLGQSRSRNRCLSTTRELKATTVQNAGNVCTASAREAGHTADGPPQARRSPCGAARLGLGGVCFPLQFSTCTKSLTQR